MQGIARIKLTHAVFIEILNQSIETHWNKSTFSNQDEWARGLNNSDVIHQWDPERDLVGRPLARQAIQIGIRGEVIKKYVSDFIVGVEDVSDLVHEIGRIKKLGSTDYPPIPIEREYKIPKKLFGKLGCAK